MLKQLFLILPIVFMALNTFANEVYLAEKGDTLSHVAHKKFKGERIYGKGGMLDLLIKENPHIKNPNKIFPSQTIYLPNSLAADSGEEITAPVVDAEIKNETIETEDVQIVEQKSEPLKMSAFALYGARYYSLTQEKQLGRAEIADLSFASARLGLIAHKGELYGQLTIGSYSFKSDYGSKQMLAYELLGGWKSYLLGMGREDQPVLRPGTTLTVLAKQTLTYLSAGLKHEWIRSEETPSSIGVKGLVQIPLAMSTEMSGLTVDGVSGYGLKLQAEYIREIAKTENYSFNFNWQNDITYWDISQDTKLNTTAGKVDSQFTGFSTMAGVLIKF